MAEYIEKEKLVDGLNKTLKNIPSFPSDPIGRELVALGIETVVKTVKAIPAADVQPVVLCRDCKHRDPEDHKCDCGQLERAGCVFPVDDNYFCAYGEE